MLRSALLCAALGLLRAQPLPCPPACKCVFRDAAQCTGSSVARIAELGLPVNLTHILLFQMGRGTLQNHSFSGMTVLQRLMLSDSHISAIAPGTFDDLIKLKTLRLSRNKITHLPGALLDKTVLLEQLFLDRNELKDIDQNMFQKLVNLQELFLNQNQLAFLPARLFTNLGNLKVLDLSRNNLTHLPRGLFGAQAKLEKLVLHSNQLVSLDSGLLSSLRALVELQLDRNRIRSIAPGAFDRLRSLSSLTLSRNHLEFLPPALFLYSHNLTFLTLFENPLEELPEVLFGELAGLQELWLNCTRLRTLPTRALFGGALGFLRSAFIFGGLLCDRRETTQSLPTRSSAPRERSHEGQWCGLSEGQQEKLEGTGAEGPSATLCLLEEEQVPRGLSAQGVGALDPRSPCPCLPGDHCSARLFAFSVSPCFLHGERAERRAKYTLYISVSPPTKTSPWNSWPLSSNIQKSMESNLGYLNQLYKKLLYLLQIFFFNTIKYDKVANACLYLFSVLVLLPSLEEKPPHPASPRRLCPRLGRPPAPAPPRHRADTAPGGDSRQDRLNTGSAGLAALMLPP
ncbi:platelet glycoprotein v-like [Lynx pardinus]|uniref:Platelet glycoprotein v-like n=1 Tax=Lynx pardinus TaxID=191816 RepID=A0A485N2S8_LYNPA|nr:platelet glycoprotein v-like [Lynx pardinus]